jgi:hypothetical protein
MVSVALVVLAGEGTGGVTIGGSGLEVDGPGFGLEGPGGGFLTALGVSAPDLGFLLMIVEYRKTKTKSSLELEKEICLRLMISFNTTCKRYQNKEELTANILNEKNLINHDY